MLQEFLAQNRGELAARCRAKVVERLAGSATYPDPLVGVDHGVPDLIEQLIRTLGADGEPRSLPPDIGTSATHHGGDLRRSGFTVEQVVHSYGDLCQAVTELAVERGEPITVEEFHTFNRCLDNAIADAVTEFSRVRDRDTAEANAETTNERLGSLAHELRNQLNSAVLAFQAIKSGSVAIAGATGKLLERNLQALRDLVDCSLADVRLTAGLPQRRTPIAINDLIGEVGVAIAIDAATRGLSFSIAVEPGLWIHADRQLISSALANLLHNAVAYTRPGGAILLIAQVVADRVTIRVEDGCGGLPDGMIERMFRPFARHDGHRIGLGLSISRRAVEINGGKLDVRSVAGMGCIFTIDLPRPWSVS